MLHIQTDVTVTFSFMEQNGDVAVFCDIQVTYIVSQQRMKAGF
jgi:hypothetical protein